MTQHNLFVADISTISHWGLSARMDLDPPSDASEPTPHRNVFVISPEERHSDQPTWESILLSIGETELAEVYGQKRDQDRTRRQLLIPSPLQIDLGWPPQYHLDIDKSVNELQLELLHQNKHAYHLIRILFRWNFQCLLLCLDGQCLVVLPSTIHSEMRPGSTSPISSTRGGDL